MVVCIFQLLDSQVESLKKWLDTEAIPTSEGHEKA